MPTPTFTTPPTPPTTADPTNFDARADDFLSWFVTFYNELVVGVAWIAAAVATVAQAVLDCAASVTAAAASALTAQNAAAAAMSATTYTATSGTNLSITTGNKAFTLNETGRSFAANDRITIMRRSAPETRARGSFVSYAANVLTVNIDDTPGGGPYSDWMIMLTTLEAVSYSTYTQRKRRERLLYKNLLGTLLSTTQRTLTTSLVDYGPQGAANPYVPTGKVWLAKVTIANIGAADANADLYIVDTLVAANANDGYRAKNIPVATSNLAGSIKFERGILLTAGQKLQARASAGSTLDISIEWIEEDAGVFLVTTQVALGTSLADLTPYGSAAACPAGKVRTYWIRISNTGLADTSVDLYLTDAAGSGANDNYRLKTIPVLFNTINSAIDIEIPVQITAGQKLRALRGAGGTATISMEVAEDVA